MPTQPLILKVISLYMSQTHGEPSVPVPSLCLRPYYGIVGDSHMEERVVNNAGELVPNRHFTAVHPAELGKIAHALDVPFIDPAWIKANICFTCSAIENFTETLIPGTQLLDAQGRAVLEIKGVTDPCLTGGEYVAAQFPHLAVKAPLFPKAAYMLRGVHGIALEEITIQLYDSFRVQLP
ncbi:MAG TPA: hypothetical protein VGM01_00680 [Ktedonobacteraceae bacterium]